jgi:MFS family permease
MSLPTSAMRSSKADKRRGGCRVFALGSRAGLTSANAFGNAMNADVAALRVETAQVSDAAAARRGTTILVLLAAAALMVNYVETMLVPALPTLVGFYHGVPYTTIAWVVSAYLIVGVATTPVFAKLGDIFGKKRILVVVLTIYAAAVAVTGFTPQIAALLGISRSDAVYLLIAVRGIQGVGLALFPLAFAMVGEELPPARVGPAQGLIAAMFAIGAALGLFVGAWLIQTYGWQVAYHTVIPVAAAILGLAVVALPESRHRLRARLDVAGAGLLGGALASFLLALSEGPTWGWGRLDALRFGPVPFGAPELFALAIALAALFVWQEATAAEPMIRLERFRERNLAISFVGIAMVGTAIFLGFVALTVLVETPIVGLGRSVFAFGVLSLPTTMSMLVAAPFVGRGITRFGPKPMVLLGALIATVGFLLLLAFHGSYIELMLAPIPVFVGLVAMIVSITNVVVLSSRRGETGIQTGMSEMFQDLGASVGPVLVAAVLASLTGTYSATASTAAGPVSTVVRLPTLAAFDWLFALGSLLTVAVGVLALFLRNYRFSADGERAGHGVPVATPDVVAAPD